MFAGSIPLTLVGSCLARLRCGCLLTGGRRGGVPWSSRDDPAASRRGVSGPFLGLTVGAALSASPNG